MIPALALLLACAGPPPAEAPPLAGLASFSGVELQLPGPRLLIRAAEAQVADPERGQASEVSAQLGEAPGLSIQSQRASWDLRGQTVVFEGEVHAVRGTFTLECARLEASFEQPEQLSRAEAWDVTVRHGARVATGERAVLDVASGQLELQGQPALREGGRSLEGERIVLFLDSERLECERCSLALAPPEAPVVPEPSDVGEEP
jgi:lipopolysaccharide export system protein LptA